MSTYEKFPDFERAEHENHAVTLSTGLIQKVPEPGDSWAEMHTDHRGDYWLCVTCGIVRLGPKADVRSVSEMLHGGRIKGDAEREAADTGNLAAILLYDDALKGIRRPPAEYEVQAAALYAKVGRGAA